VAVRGEREIGLTVTPWRISDRSGPGLKDCPPLTDRGALLAFHPGGDDLTATRIQVCSADRAVDDAARSGPISDDERARYPAARALSTEERGGQVARRAARDAGRPWARGRCGRRCRDRSRRDPRDR